MNTCTYIVTCICGARRVVSALTLESVAHQCRDWITSHQGRGHHIEPDDVWQRWRGCVVKTAYATRGRAKAVAKTGRRKGWRPAHPYRCLFGDHWHLTSREVPGSVQVDLDQLDAGEAAQ